ncbi:hypothetical protein RND81_11G093900 [Saponaria officinalis]|uniref:Replication protein A 70 kDa DNA-binding subunit B/D first OB fold domain-containing protein n=1 Tax=Saponaria officinalis TaxID=3572 RepID=A0AAW1HJT1_SAPOF
MAAAPFLTISQFTIGVRLTQMNVRVIHKWTRPDLKEKGNIESIKLLLLDAENQVIQATIMKQLVSFFGPKVTVGELYTIRNLTVDSNIGPDKATSNPCRLKFLFSSKVQGANDTSIPLHGYRFADFKDILNGKVATTHYIDVVGKLFEIGPIVETKGGYEFRTIKLEDIQGCQLSCTLWRPHTVQVSALISQQPNLDQSKIIVIQCVEAKKYEGQWRVQTTFNATVFHVNPDIPEVKQFEPSFSTPSASNSLQVIDIPNDDEHDVFTTENIKSICDIKQHEKKGLYYTLAKVVDVDGNAGWYYDSCKICWAKTVKNDNGRWICTRDGCDGKIYGLSSSIPSMSDDDELADKWHAKYTELFKEDFDTFKSNTKGLGVRVENVKLTIGGSSGNLTDHYNVRGNNVLSHQDEESETAKTSPKITPLKRPYPCLDAISGEQHEMNVGTGDATLATKKPVFIKKEK